MRKLLLSLFSWLLLVFPQTIVLGIVPSLTPSDDVQPASLLHYLSQASLTLQANVYFGDEDEESYPIAETDFYLLDESLVRILQKAKFKPEVTGEKHQKPTDEDYLEATARAFDSTDEESELIALLIHQAISRHQIAKIETDRYGKGKARTIKAGSYFLFGIARTEDEVLVWNQPVKIVAGSNLIEIDQHDADVVLTLKNKPVWLSGKVFRLFW